MDYEAEDKAALKSALVALHTCPKCRRNIHPCWDGSDSLSCVTCDTNYPITPESMIIARATHRKYMKEIDDAAR